MLSDGNSGKPTFAASRYLKYAIGEIILVVIGILIALYINNMNEDRKAREREVQLYQNAILDLKEEATKSDFKKELERDFNHQVKMLNSEGEAIFKSAKEETKDEGMDFLKSGHFEKWFKNKKKR